MSTNLQGSSVASSDPAAAATGDPSAWFADMVDRCLDFAAAARAEGRPLVGIMCEFTPRELILAAGGVPVCLCGGSADTISAAEQVLPANLCPLIKSTFGYQVLDRNPFLRWADLVVAETTCDGKKKMFELLAESKPMYVLELPHKADDADALGRWTVELHKFRSHLQSRFRVPITDDDLRAAIRLMNRERGLRRRLAELLARDTPPLTGRQLLDCKSLIAGMPADLEQYEALLERFGSLPERDAHPGSAGASRPVRVLLTGVPIVHGAERVLDLIEAAGAVVVAQENCTGLKPLLDDVDESDPDPIAALARKYYHLPCSVLTPNTRRLESLQALTSRFRPECVIELVWQACLTYDVESFHVRRLVEETLRLPYLKLVTDYSPADSSRLRVRIEALLETVRAPHRMNPEPRPADSP